MTDHVADAIRKAIGEADRPWDTPALALLNRVADLLDESAAAPLSIERPRLRDCVEGWPEAETGGYDPRCCRWPKSCSADCYPDDTPADMLEAPRDREHAATSDSRPLPENVDGHCMGPYVRHPGGRTCGYHPRLGVWTLDGTQQCLRTDHPDPRGSTHQFTLFGQAVLVRMDPSGRVRVRSKSPGGDMWGEWVDAARVD